MSTRSSIVYVAGLHIFEETLTKEVCIYFYEEPDRKFNEIEKTDKVITLSELKKIRDQLNTYLGDL